MSFRFLKKDSFDRLRGFGFPSLRPPRLCVRCESWRPRHTVHAELPECDCFGSHVDGLLELFDRRRQRKNSIGEALTDFVLETRALS